MGFGKKLGIFALVWLTISGIGMLIDHPYGSFNSNTLEFVIFTTIFVLFTLLSVGGMVLVLTWPYRCKKCKNWFVMKKGSSEYSGTQKSMIRVQTGETRSEYNGKVIQRHYSDVEHKRDVYDITYVCKHCGNEKHITKTGKAYRS